MPEFDITDATYARNIMALQKLKNSMLSHIDYAISTLNSSPEYNNFINTIQQNWQGADKEQFLKEFNQSIANLTAAFRARKSIIENAIDADIQNFKKLQEQNAERIANLANNIITPNPNQ